MKRPSLLIIFLTVFIDLVGFGIVLPLLPVYSQNFGASGWEIGALMASFSLMQFIFAPFWGRLSDRIGRRPVLLASTLGAAASYGLFAYASGLSGRSALGLILASRVFAGICGANITVAQAYIADVSRPEERSKKMGLIGMAFGLGFTFGPALSGLAIDLFGVTGPGWVAAAMCAANFLLALAILPESWKPSSEHVPGRPRLNQWAHTLSRPKVGLLVGIFFVATFCFACFETTLGLLVARNFDLRSAEDAKTIGYLFAYCGLIGAFVQGGAIGRLVKALGEGRLIALSFLLVALSLGPMPFVFGWPALLVVLALLAIGSSLTRPPVFGLISMLTSPQEQGATIGVAQSAGSLARIIGPMFAASLFEQHAAVPYVICAGISLLAGAFCWVALVKRPLPALTARPESAG